MNEDLITRLHSAEKRIFNPESNANRDRRMYAALYRESADELEAAKPVNCRGCKNLVLDYVCEQDCTDGDKFKPLPIVRLYKVLK